MPNLLQRGATWLGPKLETVGGRTVTYGRRTQTFSVTGTPNKIDYEVDDEDGIPRKVTFYDWTFTAADLDFANDPEPFTARAGDQITETLSGIDYTYEVTPPGKRPVSEWLDSAGILVIVHTKLVKQCPTPS